MEESKFSRLAEKLLIEIEEAIEVSGADIDYDTAGDILTLEFANASQIIINKQTPLSQIWVAARSGGFHFDYHEDQQVWCLHGDHQRDLFSQLSLYCSEQAGEPVLLEVEARFVVRSKLGMNRRSHCNDPAEWQCDHWRLTAHRVRNVALDATDHVKWMLRQKLAPRTSAVTRSCFGTYAYHN